MTRIHLVVARRLLAAIAFAAVVVFDVTGRGSTAWMPAVLGFALVIPDMRFARSSPETLSRPAERRHTDRVSWWLRDVLTNSALAVVGFALFAWSKHGVSWWLLLTCPAFGLFTGTLRAEIHNEWHPLRRF